MPRRRLSRPPGGPRAVAQGVLVRVETTDAFADVLLEHRLAGSSMSPADRRLAMQLVLGTLAWQGWLDARLEPALDRPLGGLDPPVRAALRLGAFQLLRLDRIPRHAAINETVRLAGHRGARALVNAVLRRIAEAPATTPPPDTDDPIAEAAAACSHPTWIAALLAADVAPDDLRALLAANNEPAPTTLRVHTSRADRATVRARLAEDGIASDEGHWAATALVVTAGAARLRGHPLLADGHITVQSEASQLVVALVDARAGERVVDLCAAPGGKTGALVERTGPAGLVVALDPSRAGARRTRANTMRLGGRALTVVADGRHPPLADRFDAVLVDAPCSGLGTLRRHPEIRWRRRPEDLARLAVLQAELLDAAANLVRDGGRLVYAVCTLTRVETWDVVAPWLARQSRFRLEPADAVLGPGAAPLVDRGALRTLPAPHGLDGFFAVRLRAAARPGARE
jgi:16S rRNA (cytosine967-C5)-methyltransferase